MGSNMLLWPGLPKTGGWVGPTQWQSAGCALAFALISIRRQWRRVNQGMELNFFFLNHLSILRFEPWCTLAGTDATCVHPSHVGLGGVWGQSIMNH